MATNSLDSKRWIFSGLDNKSEEMTLRSYIEELGGKIVDRKDKYTFLCTHVLVRKFQATEKILAALAAGKWVVTYRYVEDSYKRRKWLEESMYEVPLMENVARYCRASKESSSSGMYQGWTFFVDLGQKDLTRSIRRIIAAGDGEVASDAELSKVNVVISEKGLLNKVRLKVGPLVPIISFDYLKETLIRKKNPSKLKNYMLDGRGNATLPRQLKKFSSESPILIQESESPVMKRPLTDIVITSNKKVCSNYGIKCPPTPSSKQTRMDQFLKVGLTSSKSPVPQSPVRQSASKNSRRKGSCIPFSPDKHLLITKYFVKSEPVCSYVDDDVKPKPNLKSLDSDGGVEIVEEVRVINSAGSATTASRETKEEKDCFITKVSSVTLYPQKKESSVKDAQALKSSEERTQPQTAGGKDDDCVITMVSHPSEISSSHTNKGIESKEAIVKSHIENNKRVKDDGVGSLIMTYKEKVCNVPSQTHIEQVKRSLDTSIGTVEPMIAERNFENVMDGIEDLPDLAEMEGRIDSNNKQISSMETSPPLTPVLEAPKRSALLSVTNQTPVLESPSRSALLSVTNKTPVLEAPSKSALLSVTNNESVNNRSESKESLEKGLIDVKAAEKAAEVDQKVNAAILTKEEIKMLPRDVKKALIPKAKVVRFTTEDMKKTVTKFIKRTKTMNRFNVSVINSGDSKFAQPSDLNQNSQDSISDDLRHILNPMSTFQFSNGVREMTSREISYYQASTDEDTIGSKMAETEKGIVILGIQTLQLFVTPYVYPPHKIFGHLLQKMVLETPFNLAHSRALDLSYRVLSYFPPLNTKMRNYYVQVLEAAAENEQTFYGKLHLPWKFILRPIEALQAHTDSTSDASMSSSCENDVINRKENSLGLLQFIVTLLSEDLEHPNSRESVRDHLSWKVFWSQSQDPREITPPVKQLLAQWMSMQGAPTEIRHCMAKLVTIVIELAWRCDRCMLVPISPLPDSLSNFADFLRYRMQEYGSKACLQLMHDMPTPWARSVFGAIIFQNEAPIKEQEITFGDIMAYGLVVSQDQDKLNDKASDSRNESVKLTSPRKRKQKDINKRNVKGETKLMQACIKGNIAKVQELLRVPGIDVNLSDHNGWTPLHEAVIRQHDSCVKELLRYNGCDSLDMKNTLHLYLKRAHYYTCNVGIQANNGQTALHDAVESDYYEIARLLLDHGGEALLKITNKEKETPMTLCKSEEMRQLLKSYAGKVALKGPQQNQRFGKSSILISGLTSGRHILLTYEDRMSFILSFANSYLESSGIRFCRYDIMVQSYEMFRQQKSLEQRTQSVRKLKFHEKSNPSNTDNVPESSGISNTIDSNHESMKPSQGSEVPKLSDAETESSNISNTIDSNHESMKPSQNSEVPKLSDAETEFFEQVFESMMNNLKLCRDLTAIVQGSVEEPDFVLAMRKLVL